MHHVQNPFAHSMGSIPQGLLPGPYGYGASAPSQKKGTGAATAQSAGTALTAPACEQAYMDHDAMSMTMIRNHLACGMDRTQIPYAGQATSVGSSTIGEPTLHLNPANPGLPFKGWRTPSPGFNRETANLKNSIAQPASYPVRPRCDYNYM